MVVSRGFSLLVNGGLQNPMCQGQSGQLRLIAHLKNGARERTAQEQLAVGASTLLAAFDSLSIAMADSGWTACYKAYSTWLYNWSYGLWRNRHCSKRITLAVHGKFNKLTNCQF
jgi:hypothetical protein